MQSDLIVRRELYLDVAAEGSKLQEIYLYQADFLQDDSFCTKDYIFSDGDSLEIYTKPKSENNYPKEPNIITYHDGGNKLEDLTKFNILPILPDIEYDVLLTYKTKANDIADTTIDFRSKKLEIKNCRIMIWK